MKDRRWIMNLSVDVVIESLKSNIDNKILNDHLSLEKLKQDKYLDLYEQLFDKLLKQLVDSTFTPYPYQEITPVNSENQINA